MLTPDQAVGLAWGLGIGFAAVFALLTAVHPDVLWWPTRELFARFVELARNLGRRDE